MLLMRRCGLPSGCSVFIIHNTSYKLVSKPHCCTYCRVVCKGRSGRRVRLALVGLSLQSLKLSAHPLAIFLGFRPPRGPARQPFHLHAAELTIPTRDVCERFVQVDREAETKVGHVYVSNTNKGPSLHQSTAWTPYLNK